MPALVGCHSSLIMRKLFYFLLLSGLLSATASARSVYLHPSTNAPIIGRLSANDLQIAPSGETRLTPQHRQEGWEAIAFLDDFRGFVRRSDITKDLEVQVGARVYVSPEANENRILARAAANDLFEIERLSGEWVEVSFRKPVTGYIRSGETTASRAPDAFQPPPAPTERASPEPEMPIFEDVPGPRADPSRSAPVSSREALATDGNMRLFEGRLSRSRSFLGRQQPYQFQLVDHQGNRVAYLDLNKLLITTPLDRFLDHNFLVYGHAEPIEGRRDFVIRAEHMRLK
jgi:hypothetical protein